ncbi:TPA: helix-turn-helix transcriptional regulator [Streptococcus pneumoniae]|uniref:HTH_19 domain protein n=4 Tax=root TaxID=1 RepID=A0A141E021_9CAUD|nr:S24 family peptidase [Streptococcus pneumoniae]YP_009324932.1 transcriptional repressor [Streptococcus phage phiARI0462]ALA47768.1 HTH_19 domain protein [Streptococcus phage phiARI0455b]ALA47080.1 HTH_19 domain protein [Streptococcus phage phiARI0462]EJG59327.1 helix-turn-helix family protein [Streptococcus pneumoniae 2071004]MBW8095513.1 helix-turn-helix transcriptional regulator [Streptococcus pneumoniae]MDD0768031.1 helix-turn-helix domain-containing protein [Streptococcus pneumoniae]
MKLGELLKSYRTEHKLSMDAFCELSDLTKGYISMLEKNEHPKSKKPIVPSYDTIEKIAKGMQISTDDLINMLDDEQEIQINATPAVLSKSQIQSIYDELEPNGQRKVVTYAEKLRDEQEKRKKAKINEVSENIIRLDDYRQTTYRRVTGVVSAGSGSIQDDDLDMEVSFYEDEIPDDYDAIAYVVGNSMEPKIKNGDYLFIKNTQQVDYNTIGIFQVDGANYVKKLRQGYLESLNPDYEDIHLDESNDIRTIGEVVSVYREK